MTGFSAAPLKAAQAAACAPRCFAARPIIRAAVQVKSLLACLVIVSATVLAAAPGAEPYCKRLPFDDEVPAGLVGKYEVVGKDGKTGRPYAGDLVLSSGKGAYAVKRSIGGRRARGVAWIESCGPDRIQRLFVEYHPRFRAYALSCYLRFDGDNFTRASCTTFDGRGLEAWFQVHEPPTP